MKLYAQIIPYKPQNMDLVLFQDLDLLHQTMYGTFKGNTISHIGLVVIFNEDKVFKFTNGTLFKAYAGVPYIMHALGKHAGLTRSIHPDKKEGVVLDKLFPYFKESIESPDDPNNIYLRVKRTTSDDEEYARFIQYVERMMGRPYNDALADRLLTTPIAPLPPYKKRPEVIEPKSTFCSGLVTSFCVSGHLFSPPINRPDLKNMTRAEFSPWVNQNAFAPADFWDDEGIINLSDTYYKPVRFYNIPAKKIP